MSTFVDTIAQIALLYFIKQRSFLYMLTQRGQQNIASLQLTMQHGARKMVLEKTVSGIITVSILSIDAARVAIQLLTYGLGGKPHLLIDLKISHRSCSQDYDKVGIKIDERTPGSGCSKAG